MTKGTMIRNSLSIIDEHPVLEKVRTAIMVGELLPRTTLKPVELAEMFHCGTVPIREALIRLSERGLVRYKVNLGYEVAHYELLEQIKFIKFLYFIYHHSIPKIFELSNYEKRIKNYIEFAEKQLKSKDLFLVIQRRCIIAFDQLLLSRPAALLAGRIYDIAHERWIIDGKENRAKALKFIRLIIKYLKKILNIIKMILNHHCEKIQSHIF